MTHQSDISQALGIIGRQAEIIAGIVPNLGSHNITVSVPYLSPAVGATFDDDLPAIGTPMGGGFFAGRLAFDGAPYGFIVSPKLLGERADLRWGHSDVSVPGARSLHDGWANTLALAEAGSEAAQWLRSLTIGGNDDWYWPSRKEKSHLADVFMPGAGANPEQTLAEAFKKGGPEAFEEAWYWTSTEFSPGCAWLQNFTSGLQDYGLKDFRNRVRAVRKFLI